MPGSRQRGAGGFFDPFAELDATQARVSGADVANGLSDAGLNDVACLPIGVVMDGFIYLFMVYRLI